MLEVSNGRISLTRGDTATLTVDIVTESGQPYKLKEGDVLTLTVKESPSDIKNKFQIKNEDGSNIFKILPEHTSSLNFATYRYDVQLNTKSGDVYTVIPPKPFHILEEVTYE